MQKLGKPYKYSKIRQHMNDVLLEQLVPVLLDMESLFELVPRNTRNNYGVYFISEKLILYVCMNRGKAMMQCKCS